MSDLGDRDEMHRMIQFAVPTRVEAVAFARSAGRLDWRGGVARREPGRVTDVSEDQAGTWS